MRHRDTVYVNLINKRSLEPEQLRVSILAAIFYNLVIDLFDNIDLINVFEKACNQIDTALYEQLLNKFVLQDEAFFRLVRPYDNDFFENYKYTGEKDFMMVYLTKNPNLVGKFHKDFYVYTVQM